ncbi:Prophage integrase IntA [Paraburkholderia nemoris]|uniref:tyrosine-type recombinase/integrase n=1 Tax=Paraburkholderia nemoris TaxID=2793076 RepID=UPI00190E121D|nr:MULTISPECIES: site-specific integrase [Paraburkholderia]MBK3783951.1 tyrosine-type recombinase/integrase [Paraburkholderia aspalathi]CAE6803346.1 Prophage integrase IntA [Paraburkholderia nemoris]
MPAAPVLSLVTPTQQSKLQPDSPKELTKADIEKALPGSKLGHRNRLYLYTSLKGVRTWRWAYRLFDPAKGADGQYEVKVGVWPAMSIKQAEAAQAKAWADYVQKGQHPPQHRTAKAADKAKAVEATKAATVWTTVESWFKASRSGWVPSYALQVETYLTRYCGPDTALGARPVAQVTRKEIKDAIVAIAANTPSVARLIKQWLNASLEHAADGGEIAVNPMAGMKTKTAAPAPETVNSPALGPSELRTLVQSVNVYKGDRRIRLMLLLLAHTCVRSSELRCADWSEFDLPGARWTIPAARMKMKRLHIVPLSRQVVALLGELQHVSGTTGLLFKNENDPARPMPQSSAREAVYRLTAKEFTPHGFRSTFSTQANEADIEPRYVEAVLAHGKKNKVEASYNKATYYGQRVELMRCWSDYLDALVTGPFLP